MFTAYPIWRTDVYMSSTMEHYPLITVRGAHQTHLHAIGSGGKSGHSGGVDLILCFAELRLQEAAGEQESFQPSRQIPKIDNAELDRPERAIENAIPTQTAVQNHSITTGSLTPPED